MQTSLHPHASQAATVCVPGCSRLYPSLPPYVSQAQLVAVYDGSLRLGLLPTHLWPSGHVFFIQRQGPRTTHHAPCTMHRAPCTVHQAPGTRHRARCPRTPAHTPMHRAHAPCPCTMHRARQAHLLGISPIAVHLTFQNCDQSGKRHRIREVAYHQVLSYRAQLLMHAHAHARAHAHAHAHVSMCMCMCKCMCSMY